MNSTSPSLPLLAFLLSCGIALSLLISCDAPHDNPLDPSSPYYSPPPEPPFDPSIFGGRVRTLHTARNFPISDGYQVLAEAWAPPELVMDSIYVRFNGLNPVNLRRASQDTSSLQVWKTPLTPSFLNGGDDDPEMRAVPGKPFIISFAVQGDTTYSLDTLYVFRVIYDTPIQVLPTGRDTVSNTPLLMWEPFSAPWEFDYRVTVWRDEAEFEVLIWESDTLTADTNQVMVDVPLPTGNYYWTLFVIDAFGNNSRSTEGEFYARPESLP